MNGEERDVKGIYIPIEVWNFVGIGWTAKLIFLEIHSFARNDKECFVSNKYLAMMFNISETQVSLHINSLIKIGWLSMTKFDGRKRYLKSNMKTVFLSDEAFNSSLTLPETQSQTQPLSEVKGRSKADFNHTSKVNTTTTNDLFIKEKKNGIEIPESWNANEFGKYWNKFVTYLHEKTKKKMPQTTANELARQLVLASREDFETAKKIIDRTIIKRYTEFYELPKNHESNQHSNQPNSSERKFTDDYYKKGNQRKN